MIDVSYLSPATNVTTDVPLSIQGTNSGAAEIAQRVMTLLLASSADEGRTFNVGIAGDIGARNNFADTKQAENLINISLSEIKEVIRQEERQRETLGFTLGTDELLQDIILVSVEVLTDSLSLELDVVSQAGETVRATYNQ